MYDISESLIIFYLYKYTDHHRLCCTFARFNLHQLLLMPSCSDIRSCQWYQIGYDPKMANSITSAACKRKQPKTTTYSGFLNIQPIYCFIHLLYLLKSSPAKAFILSLQSSFQYQLSSYVPQPNYHSHSLLFMLLYSDLSHFHYSPDRTLSTR